MGVGVTAYYQTFPELFALLRSGEAEVQQTLLYCGEGLFVEV